MDILNAFVMAVRPSMTIHVASYTQGIVHYELIPEGRTVSKEMHVEILRRFRDTAKRKYQENWTRNS
jgi:hypothetical protein